MKGRQQYNISDGAQNVVLKLEPAVATRADRQRALDVIWGHNKVQQVKFRYHLFSSVHCTVYSYIHTANSQISNYRLAVQRQRATERILEGKKQKITENRKSNLCLTHGINIRYANVTPERPLNFNDQNIFVKRILVTRTIPAVI